MKQTLQVKTKILIVLILLTSISLPSWSTSLLNYDVTLPQTIAIDEFEEVGNFNFKPNKEIFYADNRLEVYSAYPNPVNGTAFIDYQFFQNDIRAQIVVTDVLGNMMNQYPLIYSQNQLRIQTQGFTAGVYFYTLSVDGKVMATKKLVVKEF